MLRYDWTVSIDGVDVSPLVKAAGSIDYGIKTPGSGFSAPTAVFDMFSQDGWPQYDGAWPDIDLGMEVIIHVTWDGVTQWRRFTGVVQGIDWEEMQRRITCAGTVTQLDYHWSGSTSAYAPRPAETDIDRVAWLATSSDPTVVTEGAPGRWLRAVPDNQPNQPLLDQLLRIADDCDAHLQQDRLGVVRYRTRYFTPPAPILLPEAMTERPTLSMNTEIGTICNSVDVYFGEPAQSTGLRPHVHDDDGTSIAAIGERRDTLNTDLMWQAGAVGKAAQYLDKRVQQWTCPDVTLLMSGSFATGPLADDCLDLQLGWPVTVATLPDGAPMAEYDGQIIGTTEIMHETDYRLILHLAPYVASIAEPTEDPIYPDGVISGYDSTGTIAGTGPDVGKTWRWCKWSDIGDSSITNSHTDQVWAQVLAVAGGGGGAAAIGASADAGSGGAGGLIHLSILIGVGTQPVTIGAGGYYGTGIDGGDSYALGVTLQGGGGGGGNYSTTTNPDGRPGGSGGGALYNAATGTLAGTPGAGVDGQGWPGSTAGGGADGAAVVTAPGPGITSAIDGTSRLYGRGGRITGTGFPETPPASSGQGGSGSNQGTSDAGHGGDGVFIVKYRIA